MLAILVAGALFFHALRKKAGALDVFELGALYAAVVVLYAGLPLASYLLGGLSFSVLSDSRLFAEQPAPGDLAPVFWVYFVYFVAFAFCYARFRGPGSPGKVRVAEPPRHTLAALFIALLFIKGFFWFVKVFYGLPDPETYGDTYLMYKNLPLLVQQLVNHLWGIALTLQILIMALLVLNFRRYRYWIIGWILFELGSILVGGIGARTVLLIPLVSAVVCYHFCVQRFRARTALALGALIVLLFSALGIARGLAEANEGLGLDALSSSNEFEILFANAYDVSERKPAGDMEEAFPKFYVGDLLNLVPQQVLPIAKFDTATWYVETFYPEFATSGGGLGFGAIAESFLGFGWIDAVWRGAFIGVIFAWLQRRLLRQEQTIWSYGFYLWVLILSYECFRGTTFSLVPRAFYQFFLVYLTIPVIAKALTTAATSSVTAASDTVASAGV